MSGFYCFAFKEYMIVGKTNLFSSNDCKKNEKIIYK